MTRCTTWETSSTGSLFCANRTSPPPLLISRGSTRWRWGRNATISAKLHVLFYCALVAERYQLLRRPGGICDRRSDWVRQGPGASPQLHQKDLTEADVAEVDTSRDGIPSPRLGIGSGRLHRLLIPPHCSHGPIAGLTIDHIPKGLVAGVGLDAGQHFALEELQVRVNLCRVHADPGDHER